jgi:hypothetical protein
MGCRDPAVRSPWAGSGRPAESGPAAARDGPIGSRPGKPLAERVYAVLDGDRKNARTGSKFGTVTLPTDSRSRSKQYVAAPHTRSAVSGVRERWQP